MAFLAPRADRVLKMTRHYAAPRALVWKVWTEPRHVAKWWGPFGPDDTRAEIDPRIGGLFHVAMIGPDGGAHPSRGEIVEIQPPEKLVIEGDPDAGEACGAGLPPGAIITILFTEEEGGTRLHFEARFPNAEARRAAEAMRFATNWEKTLDNIADHLKAGVEPESQQKKENEASLPADPPLTPKPKE